MVDVLSPDTHFAGPGDLHGLAVDEATMFADHHGQHQPRIEKKQRKLLGKVTFLKDFLEEDEKLLTITTAVSPTSFLEQWTSGFIFVYLKRCLLVVTDRRVFHIPTTMNHDNRGSVAQIRYGDVQSIEQKGSRLKIAYTSGEKEQFLYVRRSERKKIRALLQAGDRQGSPSDAGRRVHLCPKCRAELEADRYECGSCGKEFKSWGKALKLSLWLPGGGYFYTGHPILGVMDAAIELVLMAFIVLGLVMAAGSDLGGWALAGFFGLALAIEKAITVHHANHFVKEYLPADPVPIPGSPLRTTLKWAAMAFVLLFVGATFYGVLIETGDVPSDRVLVSADIPDDQYQQLMEEGILVEGEAIELFFSEGLLSVKEGGSILTKDRVIAYQQNEDGLIDIYYVPNEDIVSVTLIQQGDAMTFSVYRVSGEGEEYWLDLWLPHAYGDAERFAAAVEAKIGR